MSISLYSPQVFIADPQQAPSPRVIVSQDGFLDLEVDDTDDDDAFDGVDSETKPHRYYASQKTLGLLYRNIDEGEFLDNMQRGRRDRKAIQAPASATPSFLHALLRYIQHWTSQYVIMYEHHNSLAADIRAE